MTHVLSLVVLFPFLPYLAQTVLSRSTEFADQTSWLLSSIIVPPEYNGAPRYAPLNALESRTVFAFSADESRG